MGRVTICNEVGQSLPEKVTFGQILEGGEAGSLADAGGRRFQAEELAVQQPGGASVPGVAHDLPGPAWPDSYK